MRLTESVGRERLCRSHPQDTGSAMIVVSPAEDTNITKITYLPPPPPITCPLLNIQSTAKRRNNLVIIGAYELGTLKIWI